MAISQFQKELSLAVIHFKTGRGVEPDIEEPNSNTLIFTEGVEWEEDVFVSCLIDFLVVQWKEKINLVPRKVDGTIGGQLMGYHLYENN